MWMKNHVNHPEYVQKNYDQKIISVYYMKKNSLQIMLLARSTFWACTTHLSSKSVILWAKTRKKVRFGRTIHYLPQRRFFENFSSGESQKGASSGVKNFFFQKKTKVFEIIGQPPPKYTFEIYTFILVLAPCGKRKIWASI